MGARPILVPYPTRRNAKPPLSHRSWSSGAWAARPWKVRGRSRVRGSKAAATAKAVLPIRARAMPTEQMRRYFQAASTERGERWKAIRGALARVVASMDIQKSPM